MWILPLLGYLGLALGFVFLTLAIASGLYYLSEVVEEHTVLAKKLLSRLVFAVIAVQLLLCAVDRFPLGLGALSVASHVVYLQNLRRFPVVKLTDPVFLLSCVLVLLNHYLYFLHFSRAPPVPPTRSYYQAAAASPTFTEIASFFGLCVWLVPFALFVSLSAGENVLPTMGSEYATGEGSSFVRAGREPSSSSRAGAGGGGVGAAGDEMRRYRRRGTNAGMAKAAVNGVKEWIGETGEVMGFWKGERTRPL
ncbi:erv26 superfamily protein [Elasticomyces elasticus]|nr:erv26 superfamily protein [Elasticomyces elasticus]